MAIHFLYLTDSRMVCLLARTGRAAVRREFEPSPEGLAEFERHLATVSNVPTHLVTDLAEEDFRPDTIPHVGARDRRAIVGRRLAQIFRGTPYRHALVQGREAEGRRDDRVVYTAITNPEVVKPWQEVLERLEVPLVGMHSAAVLGTRLVEALGLAEEHALLALVSPGGMLRQTYFRNGELRFTRLTPIDLQEGQPLGAFLAEETTRTWQYLDNLRFFAPQDRLEVALLAHPRDHGAIRPQLEDIGQLRYRLLDTDQVAAKIGLKPPPQSSSAEEILVHLFQRRPVDNHFASSAMRRYWTLRTVRAALNAVSVGVLALGLLVGGLNLVRIVRAGDQDQATEREIRQANQVYEQIARTLPTYEVGGSTMRDAVGFYAAYMQSFPTVGAFVVPLSSVLESHPAVRLSQLAWQATDDANASPAITRQPPRTPPPVKAIAKDDAAARAVHDEAASAVFAAGRYDIALLEATVSVASHDFRGALAEVERLAADIGRLEGFHADIVESPLDLRPSYALQGRDADRDTGTMDARFVLRVVHTRRSAG